MWLEDDAYIYKSYDGSWDINYCENCRTISSADPEWRDALESLEEILISQMALVTKALKEVKDGI